MTYRFTEFLILIVLGSPHAAALPPAPKTIPLAKSLTPVNIQPIAPLDLLPFPVAPQGTYANTYDYGNCTKYVAGRKNIPNSWGNAATWASRAAAEGHTVSSIPIIGAIAQKSGGLGHVAIVEAINGDQVQVTEMNVEGLNVVDSAWYPVTDFTYIYV